MKFGRFITLLLVCMGFAFSVPFAEVAQGAMDTGLTWSVVDTDQSQSSSLTIEEEEAETQRKEDNGAINIIWFPPSSDGSSVVYIPHLIKPPRLT